MSIGIGMGIYSNGFLSIKYFLANGNFLQLTIGIDLYYPRYVYERTITYSFGIRYGYNLFEEKTKYYKYIFFVGIGTGVHLKREAGRENTKIIPISEIFQEFNLFPKKINIALETAWGVNIKIKEIHPFIGGGGHLYFK